MNVVDLMSDMSLKCDLSLRKKDAISRNVFGEASDRALFDMSGGIRRFTSLSLHILVGKSLRQLRPPF